MRIFYAVGEAPSAGLLGSQIWRSNLYDSLVDLGHEVVEFDFDLEGCYAHADPASVGNREYMDRVRPELEGALLRQVEAAHAKKPVDVLFCYFYNSFCSPEIIREISSWGIATFNWYCNGSYQFHLVEEIAPAFDWSLVPERYRLEDYRRVGARPLYCQEAANPAVYHSVEVPRDVDVAFVGAAYGDRPSYVRTLADAGLPVRAYGLGWERLAAPLSVGARVWRGLGQVRRRIEGRPLHPPRLPGSVVASPLTDSEMVTMFSRAKIVLGFSVVGQPGPRDPIIRQVRLRDFEAPMSGAFYMLEYVDEIEEFFEVDKEIVCFASRKELVDKARFYLAHPEEREAIRAAGHERALRDHTWQKRLSDAFAEAGLGEDVG
ncbi:MAG: CgeB family protein [Coriobacteriia bacterium]